jgi:precorrin-6Y C5,15-methyltransferase (decarboxylating)
MQAGKTTFPLTVLGFDCDLRALAGQPLDPLIRQADVFCAGKKQLAALAAELPSALELLPIDADIEKLALKLRHLRSQGRKITLLASGDPLFFGLGASLSRYFPAEELRIYPALSSMQLACARLALPWQEMLFVSLHGRLHSDESWFSLAQAAMQDKPVCVLLDPACGPRQVAAYLLDRGRAGFTLHYFRELQNPLLEKRLSMSLQEAAFFDQSLLDAPESLPDGSHPSPEALPSAEADPPAHAGSSGLEPRAVPACAGPDSRAALLILQPLPAGADQPPPPRPYLGLPDSAFTHEAGIITKQPVRAAVLAALRLHPRHILLDLGAGCGSVGLEACSLLPQGRVYAVEQNPERAGMIAANRKRHGAANLEIIREEAALFLRNSPQSPERIFIGGGLDKKPELLTLAWTKLKPEGRLVIACVLMGTLEKSRLALEKLDSGLEISLIQATISEPLGSNRHLKALNPVFILAADKNPA